MAKAEQADEQVAGYCQACGGYGRGRFVEVINSHSDAIDQHTACPENEAGIPAPLCRLQVDLLDPSGQQRASRA